MGITGMLPSSDGPQPQGSSGVSSSADAGEEGMLPGPNVDPVVTDKLVTAAYGTTLAQRRMPTSEL